MSEFILQAAHLAKSFASPNGTIRVVRDVSLALEAGSSLSITGESGSGKTTLLNLLSGLEAPDHGAVFWEGKLIDANHNASLATQRGAFMGLVFQTYYLVPELNALENVLLGRRLIARITAEDKRWAHTLLDKVGLAARARHLPAKLSGGERQRVAIARALVNRPRLILADEPTGNLDEKTGERVMDILLNLCAEENVALLLVTHHAGFAARTGRTLHLTEGAFTPNLPASTIPSDFVLKHDATKEP